MEVSKWLSEMGTEYEMNDFDELIPLQLAAVLGNDFDNYFSTETLPTYQTFNLSSQTCFERPAKQMKAESWNSCTTDHISTSEGSSSPNMLSFGNSSSPTSHPEFYENPVFAKPKDEGTYVNHNYALKVGQGNKRPVAATLSTKPASYSQDHILAERKRREKLSQRFIALSAIVPGLKKMDKASVLADSIKYVKELQERVKAFEEQTTKKTMESVVFVKKVQIPWDDDSCSTGENFTDGTDEQLPEIEARVSDKNLLIRIHCERRKGVLVKTLAEIEKLNLTVVSSNSLPFGTSTLDITVMAQMDEDFDMTVKDTVKTLRSNLRQFM